MSSVVENRSVKVGDAVKLDNGSRSMAVAGKEAKPLSELDGLADRGDSYLCKVTGDTVTVLTSFRDILLVPNTDVTKVDFAEPSAPDGVTFIPLYFSANVNLVLQAYNVHLLGGDSYKFKSLTLIARTLNTVGSGKAFIDTSGTRGLDPPTQDERGVDIQHLPPPQAEPTTGLHPEPQNGHQGDKGRDGGDGGDAGNVTVFTGQPFDASRFEFDLSGGQGGDGETGFVGQQGSNSFVSSDSFLMRLQGRGTVLI